MNAQATETARETVTLYVADTYLPGCPSNGAGRRVGYGLTPEDAIAHCEPWANQAPFFVATARAVEVQDLRSLDGEEHAEHALDYLRLAPGPTRAERQILRLMAQRRLATAVQLAGAVGVL